MDNEQAKKIIEDIFRLANIAVESISYSWNDKRGHIFSIKSTEFDVLQSDRPDLAKDMVYLLKRLFNRHSVSGEEIYKCTIDINDLQSKTDDKIRIKALNAAEEAKNLKTDVTMEPMSSYERMVVHSVLAGMPNISTESIGLGKDRRLKVKYLSI